MLLLQVVWLLQARALLTDTDKSKELGKQAAAEAAVKLVQDGMTIGLGTGSTAAYFIRALARKGTQVKAIATSKGSEILAEELGLVLIDPLMVTHLDLDIDGADEIDDQKRMIKGGGGALVREKIIASMAREMIVIADFSKRVQKLGTFGLPLEILPFCFNATLYKLERLGLKVKPRQDHQGRLVMSDNGNIIADAHHSSGHFDLPEQWNSDLKQIPGVVDTGFFLKLAGRVLIGNADGTVTTL